MVRYLWRALFLIALTLCALFPRALFLKVVDWEMRLVFHHRFGAHFTYDDLTWKAGKLILEGGKIAREGSFCALFSRATWVPNFHLWRRELGGGIVIENLDIAKEDQQALPRMRLKKPRLLNFNFDVSVIDAHLKFSDVDLYLDVVRQEEHLTFKTDLEGHNLSDLYATFCSLFRGQLPEPLVDWNVVGGELKGEVSISFADGRLNKLCGRVDATKIEAENGFLELYGEWEKLHADFDLDLSSSLKVNTWNGTFGLIGGRLALQYSEYWHGMWDFSDLYSMVSVQEGKVESSFLRGKFLGMEGEVDLDWQSRETLMDLAFSGTSQEMFPLIPETFQEGFQKAFPSDRFTLNAHVKRAKQGLKLEGSLEIDTDYHLDFGCHFGGADERVDVVPERLLELPPPTEAFLENLKEQFCLSNKRLGWFHGEGFALEKFLAPFLPLGEEVQISGQANFEGTFDERYLAIFYEGERFHLEGEAFDLQIDRVSEEAAANVVAVHYIDLKTGDHVGLLPLVNGRYQQKRQGVLFEPVNAMVHIENNFVRMKEITTTWAALELRGEASVNLDDFDFHLTVPHCNGPLEDAVDLCSQFYPLDCLETAVVGSFTTEGKGLSLHYGEGKLQALNCSGGGVANTRYRALTFEENRFAFDYDHKKGAFAFRDVKGSVLFSGRTFSYCIPLLRFAPEAWELEMAVGEMAPFSALLKEGELTVEGEEAHARGEWREGSFQLNPFTFAGWSGLCRYREGELETFLLERGENRLEISGTFNGAPTFEGKIDALTFDLATLAHLSDWNPEGKIEGKGEILYDGEIKGEVEASFHALTFGGIHFGEGEHLACYFSSTSGVRVEGLEAEISGSQYKLGGFQYDPFLEKLHIDGFDFAIPADRLEGIAHLATDLFPGKIHRSLLDHLVALKHNEELAGRLSIELFPNTLWVTLMLNDGTYTLFDQTLHLRNLSLVYDPLEFNVKGEIEYRDLFFPLHLKMESASLDGGELIVDEALHIGWKEGWQLATIEGELRGSIAQLAVVKQGERYTLDGSITLDTERLPPLLPETLAQMCTRFGLTGNVALTGRWSVAPHAFEKTLFSGVVEGKNCGIYSVMCNRVHATVDYEEERLDVRNLSLLDWSGMVQAPAMVLEKKEGEWAFTCAQLALENFRLSRLKSRWTEMEKRSRPLFRSFCIPRFELNNLRGNLFQPESYTGEGVMRFTNYAKRTLFSNLMQLPTEISARLGLDLTTMIPVRGEILYAIEGAHVWIKEFKDVYSDGKRARFYLVGDDPAYIDFKGNLDVKVKMKQYTLLMKIADLFTVQVKGTLSNPTYVLSNQIDS